MDEDAGMELATQIALRESAAVVDESARARMDDLEDAELQEALRQSMEMVVDDDEPHRAAASSSSGPPPAPGVPKARSLEPKLQSSLAAGFEKPSEKADCCLITSSNRLCTGSDSSSSVPRVKPAAFAAPLV